MNILTKKKSWKLNMKKLSNKRAVVYTIIYMLILASVVYSAACIMYPEHSESVARGFSVFFNACILLLGA